jgi:hypothetical protein
LLPPQFPKSPLPFRGGREGGSRAAAEGWGLSVKRSTSPTNPTPTPWSLSDQFRGLVPPRLKGRGAFGVSPRQKVRISRAPPPPCFAWSPSPCRGGFTPLLFRGGEEPRSGGGVGFVRQTQHQPDKPHPNPVEGRGAFGVSPRHKVRITKAAPSPMLRMVPLPVPGRIWGAIPHQHGEGFGG